MNTMIVFFVNLRITEQVVDFIYFLIQFIWNYKGQAEAYERERCCDLLEAMLKMDAKEWITPSEVLVHPFIANPPFQGNLQLKDCEVEPDLEKPTR